MTDAIKRATEAAGRAVPGLNEVAREAVARHTLTAALSDREGMADEISGIVVGSGYYSTTIGVDAAREAIDAIRAHLIGGEG